eukprot:3935408-Amphidinium_carterae.1
MSLLASIQGKFECKHGEQRDTSSDGHRHMIVRSVRYAWSRQWTFMPPVQCLDTQLMQNIPSA